MNSIVCEPRTARLRVRHPDSTASGLIVRRAATLAVAATTLALAGAGACSEEQPQTPVVKPLPPERSGANPSASEARRGPSASEARRGPSASEAIDAAPPIYGSLREEMERQRKTRGDREAATAHHQAALRLHSAGRYAEAETRWAEAARADPSWERPYYNLACATALQQRPDDAIAYLELMRDSELDFYRLRKLESDRDLDSLRALPAFAQVVHDVADALLTGTFVRAGADCPTLELDVDGGFVQVCAQQRRVGEWAYADSVLYYHLSREERRDTDEARPINDYRAVAIKRFTAGELCLGRARAKRKWPTARDIGAIRAARPSAVPSGCFQHR